MTRLSIVRSALGLAALFAVQAAAQGVTQEGGYEVTRSQTVARAPHGMVGRKTTDRETRIGNTAETDGNSLTIVMTIGGFAKQCPTAEGIVAGDFEYTLTSDAVDTDEGETQRTHFSHNLLVELKGQVGNDGVLEYIEMQGTFTRRRTGAQTERTPIPPTRFRPGLQGAPDWEGMRQGVEVTGEIATATAMLMAGSTYAIAQLEWNKPNQCVEFSFDPPSDTRRLGPNESAEVQVTLLTKDGRTPVAEGSFRANGLEGVGSLAPRTGLTRAAGVPLTFTAPGNARAGNGFDVATLSRAGTAAAIWKSLAPRAGEPGWSGSIQYTLDIQGDEGQSVLQDWYNRTFVQITFTFEDGVGTATSHAEVEYRDENRRGIDRGGSVYYVKEGSRTTAGSLSGTSPATVDVRFDPAMGTYSASPGWTATVGTQRVVNCDATNCTTTDMYFSTDPQRDTGIWGTTDDPNHVHGTMIDRREGLGRAHNGVNIWTRTWDLRRSN